VDDFGEVGAFVLGERMSGEIVERLIMREHREFEPCPCSNFHKAEKHWRFSCVSRTVTAW
jgi:hypothetical protein